MKHWKILSALVFLALFLQNYFVIEALQNQKLQTKATSAVISRSQFWRKATHDGWIGAGLLLANVPNTAEAAAKYKDQFGSIEGGLQNCPDQPVKKSCWSTEDNEGRVIQRWAPPSSIQGNPQAITQELEETMAMYPQKGQNDVDRGGWKQAEIKTEGKATYIRYEFTSGRFKYIDDLEFMVDASGKVSVRTASRNAGFDYGVNATRINYIMKQLEKKGWKVRLV